MKKAVSVLILTICVFASGFAQWRVIYPNEKYNYLLSSQTDSIIRTTIWVDSSGIENGDSVYYLNKICVKKANVPGPLWSNVILQINQSQFLKNKITIAANNIQHIEGDVNWYINGNCSFGDSWIFDSTANIIAYCDSVFLGNIFGLSDSLKRIIIDATDTMLLSKNYGTVLFPGLDSLNLSYKLVGLEAQDLGLTVPSAYNFCNFNVGDEFEYESGSSSTFSGSNPHTSSSTVFTRYIIISKALYPDSVSYEIKRKFRIENYPFGGQHTTQIDTGITDTLIFYLSNPGNFLNEGFNWNYTYQPVMISWTVFEQDTIGSGYSKQFHKYNYALYGQDSLILGATNPVSYSYYANARYSEEFGLISSNNFSGTGGPGGSSSGSYKNLIACTVNGNQLGQYLPDNTYHDCSLDSIYSNYIIADKDTLIDIDTIAKLHSAFQTSSYLWSTGATTDSIVVYKAGTYTLTVTNDYGCTKVTSKKILAYKNVDKNSIVASVTNLCNNSEAILQSALNGFNYLWSTGITNSSITINSAGVYNLTTTDGYGLTSVSSITISNTHTISFMWPDDTILESQTSIQLQVPSYYDSCLWSNNETWYFNSFNQFNLEFGVNKIWATAYKNNCMESDTVIIIRSPDESDIEEDFYQFFTIENGELYLLPTAYDYTYEIYSTEGKLLTKGNYTSGLRIQPFIVKSVNSGIYLLRITTSHDSFTGKIFIRHQN